MWSRCDLFSVCCVICKHLVVVSGHTLSDHQLSRPMRGPATQCGLLPPSQDAGRMFTRSKGQQHNTCRAASCGPSCPLVLVMSGHKDTAQYFCRSHQPRQARAPSHLRLPGLLLLLNGCWLCLLSSYCSWDGVNRTQTLCKGQKRSLVSQRYVPGFNYHVVTL